MDGAPKGDMKRQTLTTLVVLACGCLGIGLAPTALGAHSTDYLDPLQTELSARLESPDLTAPQRAALNSASRTLDRRSTTLSGDLGQLTASATALDRAYGDDADLTQIESDALNRFVVNAQEQRAAIDANLSLSTTGYPRSISNQLGQIDAGLDEANGTNGVVSRSRALSRVLTKLRAANTAVARLVKAPETLDGKAVTLTERAARHPARLSLDAGGTYQNDTETGNWTYARTGLNTGVITLNIDGGATHVYDLTFKNSTSGSLTTEGEDFSGSFRVTTP